MNRIAITLRVLLLSFGMSLGSACWSAEIIPLYLYNTPPPFNPDAPDNLSDVLAELLSAHSHGKYTFKARYLPRKRLDIHVSGDKWQGAVVWANPAWFDDAKQTRYLWSIPLASDHNLVLSHKKKPVDFETPASLTGLRLGGILGHVYAEFDSMVNVGTLIRDDTTSYEQNVKKLEVRRVDVIFLPASSLAILNKQFPDMAEWLYISKQPRNTFNYYFFCDPSNAELMAFFNKEIRQLKFDRKWQNAIKTWRYTRQ